MTDIINALDGKSANVRRMKHMPESERKPQYTDDLNTALQWMWGDGYLSPGGSEEVAAMLRDVDVGGRYVLDIGSGLGAAAVTLAESYGARSVLGVDVEWHLIDQAGGRAAAAGFAEQVRFQLIDPGPLPFDDATFDMVFSKDAIVHIPDKAACYAEVYRVLRPGGVFVGSDWLRGGEETYTSEAQEWLDFVRLDFRMETLDQTREALQRSGFERVGLVDRNEWYKSEVRNELTTLSGDNYEALVRRVGKETAEHRLESSTRKQRVIELGFLRPTHFVGYKSTGA